MAKQTGSTVAGAHVNAPGFGHVVRKGRSFDFDLRRGRSLSASARSRLLRPQVPQSIGVRPACIRVRAGSVAVLVK